ncbi:hypothetical protein N480_17965 [Pseudoalteromonas luteoviolacea S2607]|uniref:TrmH family RNA methyltransferase n=1 Tax=Pseudoalteromonas luteoviolacea TaxID=43657 RepID=UPI0007B03FEB|nr:TrmH family RNA methyltransferase [Pseudoalteromonas luteoviolacea]KZN36363.1 hypothetical protein N480_17965 [Pseudoalteromonas luteoviolacea S2607]
MVEQINLTTELYEKFTAPNEGEIVVKRDYFLKNGLTYNASILELFCSQAFYSVYKSALSSLPSCRVGVVEDENIASFLGVAPAQAVLAKIKTPEYAPINSLDDKIMLLNGVKFAESVGNLVRSAMAMGISSVVACPKAVSPYEQSAFDLSSGHVLGCKVHRSHCITDTLSQLSALGYTIVSTANTAKAVSLRDFEFPEKCVLVLGSEHAGIEQTVLEHSHCVIKIDMKNGVNALTTPSAGAIFLNKLGGG